MKLETLKDFDKEIGELEEEISDIEKYIEKYPEKQGVKGNLETLYYVYNELVERKKLFLEKEKNREFLEKIRHEIVTNTGVWCTDNEKVIENIDEKCVWFNEDNIDLLNELDEKIKELS